MPDSYNKGNEVATIDVALVTVEDADGNVYGLDTSNKVQVTPVTETKDAVKLIIKGILRAQKPQKVTVTGNTLTLTDNVFNAQLVQILQGGTVTYSKKYSSTSASIAVGKHHIIIDSDYIVFNISTAVTGSVEYNDVSGVLEIVTSSGRQRKSYTVEGSAPQDSTAISVTAAADESRVKSYTPPVIGDVAALEPFKTRCYSAIYNAAGLIIGYERITYPNCKGVPIAFSSEDDVFRASDYTINSNPDTGEAPYVIDFVPYLPAVAVNS